LTASVRRSYLYGFWGESADSVDEPD